MMSSMILTSLQCAIFGWRTSGSALGCFAFIGFVSFVRGVSTPDPRAQRRHASELLLSVILFSIIFLGRNVLPPLLGIGGTYCR